MDSSLLSGEKKVAQASLAIDAHRRKGTSKNAGIALHMTLLTGVQTARQQRLIGHPLSPRVDCALQPRNVSFYAAFALSLEVHLKPQFAYGERKTARILTGTPIAVNTAKRPAISRTSVIYQGCGYFKRTFVLDAESGVDIMRPLKERKGEASIAAFAISRRTQRMQRQTPIRKTVEP